MMILAWLTQLVFVPALSPLCIGIIKKIKARFQNRQGATIFQPYKDIWKLMHKDEIISSDASWIFRFAPCIIFAATLVIGVSIPLFASFLRNTFTGDLLVVVYTLALGTFFLALAGMDTGSAFGGFGSSREMTVAALAEGGLILSLFTTALMSGTTNLFAISDAEILLATQFFLPSILAFAGFFIILLAETGRFPFDNPATHLELTMIHEAMILEYSGKRLALIEWAAANKFFIFAALGINLFFPYGIAQNAGVNAIFLGVIALLVKIFILCFIIAIIESTMAKFRFFRLPDLLVTSFILSAVAIGLIQI
ncbi:NADH-quinone oxidoreductase subunit H [Candidatus Peregrinibacteria bacterium]|nr:NADH-quinone oxidoreductase subunit H [Candidatus Peregrinibacteria bacterium]